MMERADSSVAELPLFQGEDGGAIPTSALQLYVDEISNTVAREFISLYHYSKTCPPCKHYYGAFFNKKLFGAAALGEPAMRHQKKCYGCDIELRKIGRAHV